jgi:hypothetical protein
VTDYPFHKTTVYDQIGGVLRIARNSRIDVNDPSTGLTAADLKQGGVSVPYVTTNSVGGADFTSTLATVDLVSPHGLTERISSHVAVEAAVGAGVSSDAAVAALIANGASATRVAGDVVYAPTIPSAEKIYYVSASGNDSNSGNSWAKAKATVKGALTAIGATQYARIEVGVGTITEAVAWGTVPRGTVINGSGKRATVLNHQFNGDLATLGEDVQVSNLTINGQGATYTGKCFSITGTDPGQSINSCKLYNFDSECLWIGYQAGSGFTSNECDMWRVSAGSGTGRYAVVIENVQQLSAKPRSFHQYASGGQCSFDFGGSNNTFVSQSFLNDLNYTTESRGVQISASRLASPASSWNMNGSNNTIVGCDVFSAINIVSGSGGNCIGPNAYQNAPTDVSGLTSNKIVHESYTYTPTFTSSGTAPALGAGSISGFYSRSGAMMTVSIQLTAAADTTFGTGELRFGLPYTRANGSVSAAGQAILLDGSTYYTAIAQLVGAVNYVRLARDTSGLVSGTSPFTIGTGDVIRINLTYMQ